jgi:tryptophan-rich sensory protein
MPQENANGRGYPSISLGLFVAGCVGLGSLIGILVRPRGWVPMAGDVALVPAGWLFSVGWLIYLLVLAILGHGLWRNTRTRSGWRWVFGLWWLHTILMAALGPLLFVARLPQLVGVFLIIAIATIAVIGLRVTQKDPRLMAYVLAIGAWLLFLLYLSSRALSAT